MIQVGRSCSEGMMTTSGGPSGLRLRVSVLWNVLFGCHCTLRLRGRILYFSDMRFWSKASSALSRERTRVCVGQNSSAELNRDAFSLQMKSILKVISFWRFLILTSTQSFSDTQKHIDVYLNSLSSCKPSSFSSEQSWICFDITSCRQIA